MRLLRRVAPLAVLLFCACASTLGNRNAGDEVRAALRAMVDAQNEGNVPLLLSYFSDDAILFPPTGPAIRGISGVADHYRQLFRERQVETAVRIEEVETERDLAWAHARVVGYLRSRTSGGETRIDDEWLVVLRRRGGEWQIVRSMWRAQ